MNKMDEIQNIKLEFAMTSIFYLIGLIVIVLAIINLAF